MFFLVCTPTNAQTRVQLKSILEQEQPTTQIIDSVSLFLASHSENDSLAYLHRDFSYWLYNKDFEKTILHEKKALHFALQQQNVDSAFVQQSAVNLAFYQEKKGAFLKAIKLYKKAILYDISARITLNSYEKIGYCYLQLDDYYSSISYYNYVIAYLLQEQKNTTKLRNAYLNIATAYWRLGKSANIKIAENYARKADSLAATLKTGIKTKYNIKFCLAQLNNQHEYLNIDRSLHYYNEAISLAKKLEDSTRISAAYYGRGSLFTTSDYPKALQYLQEALLFTNAQDSTNLYLIHNLSLIHI